MLAAVQTKEVYFNLSDEKIIQLIKSGDKYAQDFILDKYKDMVKIKARAYFLIGADREDVIQEGMIGLYKAIRDYRSDRETPFKIFAELCVTRQIITAIKASTRQKHIPLNSYMSLNKSVFEEDSSQTYLDMLQGCKITNPEDLFISMENKSSIENNMVKVLSPLESRILALYLQGKSYHEIAGITNKSVKSIDNALQRVKRKVERVVNEKEM